MTKVPDVMRRRHSTNGVNKSILVKMALSAKLDLHFLFERQVHINEQWRNN
jgi:hypothetical protein